MDRYFTKILGNYISKKPGSSIVVEQANYSVIRELGDIEIRRYPPLIIAKVEGQKEDAFNILFGFINGGNRRGDKVPMTAPVIAESVALTGPVISDADSLSFVIPSDYKLESVPEPKDGRIQIEKMPERLVAVIGFSGRWASLKFEKKSKELLEQLQEAGIGVRGNVFSMLYNAPYVPWFLRRNEVAVEVDSH